MCIHLLVIIILFSSNNLLLMFHRLEVFEIRGKRGRKISIILTEDVKSSIDLLNKTREQVGVSKGNPYVFARRQSNLYQKGLQCIKKCTSGVELKKPELITGTKLQKYVATVTQVASLTENDMDWVAKHLGHDIAIHRQFYRLHESTLELAKVSKLLIAVDDGNISNLAGKTLQDIELKGMDLLLLNW